MDFDKVYKNEEVSKYKINDNKELILSIAEKKSNGAINASAGIYIKSSKPDGYSGFSKGWMIPINSKEDIQNLQNSFNILCDKLNSYFN